MEKDLKTLHAAHDAWNALAMFRHRRSRCKNFAYGRQWDDYTRLPDGRMVSDGQLLAETGRVPITNNLIRQLIKSIIGRYRYLSSLNTLNSVNPINYALSGRESVEEDTAGIFSTNQSQPYADVDARTLEEFLISGCAVQRISRKDEDGSDSVTLVSPERVFFNRFMDPGAADCRLVGMLHDMSMAEVLRRFSNGEPRRALDIIKSVKHAPRGGTSVITTDLDVDFAISDAADTCRVIEVWQRLTTPTLRCHDTASGEYYAAPLSAENLDRIDRLNSNRTHAEIKKILAAVCTQDLWQQSWLLPDGTLLRSVTHKEESQPGIVLTLYPMIDGEVHSLVEDLIGQQKYVNRLVTLLDDVLSNSAKGAVLYPTDQLPDGMTWQQLRALWKSPSSIIPFKRTDENSKPEQLITAGNVQGATEMLRLQLDLFNEISGSADALRSGARGSISADFLRQQSHQTTLAMLDVLATFHAFTLRRDKAIISRYTNTVSEKLCQP